VPFSRGSATARRRCHKAGSTWSGMLVSFDRVQWLDASRRGIPLDCLNPTLDIPSEFSRRASIFVHSPGIPNSGARDRLSNPFGGSACDLSRLSWTRTLAYKGRKRSWLFTFLPVGHEAGAVAILYRRRIRSVSSTRGRRPLGGAFMGGVTVFIRSVRWWLPSINILWPCRRSPFRLLPPFLP